MAAITTIQNLVVQDSTEILGFWNNAVGDLVLYQIDAKEATKKPPPKNEPVFVPAASATSTTGKLMNPSSIIGFSYNNLPTVWGIIDKKVWKLSPVAEPLGSDAAIDELTPSLAGCTDGQGSGWLYFYKGNSTTKQLLREWTLGGGIGDGMNNIVVRQDSYLAAVYVGGASNERRVIYQAPGTPGLLNIVNPDTGSNSPIETTDNVAPRTPIAAVVAGEDDASSRIYIYYINGGGAVYKVLSKPGKWDQFEDAVPSPALNTKPTSYTQIGVTAVPGDKANYVTYVVEVNSKKTFRTFKDPWKV